MKKFFVILSVLFLCNFCINISIAKAENIIQEIIVEGNQRVSDETIKKYLNITENEIYDADKIDSYFKKLFSTGFFDDIQINYENNKLLIKVIENPVINEVIIRGNKAIENRIFENEISIKPRHTYSKYKVQNETKKIVGLYKNSGRYAVSVEPKIEKLPGNRVNLIFMIDEGIKTKIIDINFIGNKNYNDGRLKEVLFSHEYHILKFFSAKSNYDEELIALDKELLKKFYNSKGYADFSVISSIGELTSDKQAFVVNFIIDEGPRYNFGEIKLQSSIKNLSLKTIEDTIFSQENMVYNNEIIDKNIEKITNIMSEKGFAFVNVDAFYDKDEVNKKINMTYTINEGPKVYINRINISGNNYTHDDVILRELRFVEGDPYNLYAIKRSKQNLMALDFFENVNIDINDIYGQKDRIDIDVSVREKSTGGFEIAGGFSTTDGLIAKVMAKENNFLGKGQNINLSYQTGTKGSNIQLSFTEPYFMNKDLSMGFDIFNISKSFKEESSYNKKIQGFSLRSGYPIDEYLEHNIYYTIKDEKVSNIQGNASAFIKAQEGHHTSSILGHALIWDYLDDANSPSDGNITQFNQEFAGLGGNVSYIKHEFKNSYFVPIVDDKVFVKLGMKVGHITGIFGRKLNINNHFFLGGNDLRGFEAGGVGPRDISTDDALGAKFYYTGTSELNFPLGLPKELNISGSAFIDIGSFFNSDLGGAAIRNKKDLRASAGFGILWKSAMGPLRMDLAYPLLKDSEDKTQFFQLSIGANF